LLLQDGASQKARCFYREVLFDRRSREMVKQRGLPWLVALNAITPQLTMVHMPANILCRIDTRNPDLA
jgi:hypothetical protein